MCASDCFCFFVERQSEYRLLHPWRNVVLSLVCGTLWQLPRQATPRKIPFKPLTLIMGGNLILSVLTLSRYVVTELFQMNLFANDVSLTKHLCK